MVKHEGLHQFAEQKARETLDRMAFVLAEAVAAVEPANSTASPLEIFPEPGQRRADTEFSLPAEQETAFRAAMSKLGMGREIDQTASEVGLKDGYVAIIEGGQAHKMIAELNTVLSDPAVRPSAIVVAATPDRIIPDPASDKAKEKEVTARVFNTDIESIPETEYDVAQQVIYKIPDLLAQRLAVLELSYDMDGNVSSESTGQFKRIGMVNHITPVYLLRVDREYDRHDPKKYRTLGSKNLIKVVDGMLRQNGETQDVGFVTSATYQPSREVDAASAMLEIERQGVFRNVGVITYGTHQLAEVKKEPYPQLPALGQLAGEAHKASKQLEALRSLLEKNAEA